MFAKYSSEFKHFFSLKLDFTFITSKIILFNADFKNEALKYGYFDNHGSKGLSK